LVFCRASGQNVDRIRFLHKVLTDNGTTARKASRDYTSGKRISPEHNKGFAEIMLSAAGVCLLGSICLMRAIRLFIAEGEGAKREDSAAQGTGTFEKSQKAPVTYQVPEPASALVREEDFAKPLRLARYLAASSLPPARALEPAAQARAPKQERTVTKAGSKAKAGPARQKTGEAELAKERRRAQQLGRHKVSTGIPGRSEKQRSGPNR
jgi:hypothetical protein